MVKDDVRFGDFIKIKRSFEHGSHISIDDFFYCSVNLILHNYIHIGPQCGIIGGKNVTFTMKDFTFLAIGSKVICSSDNHKGDGIGIPFIDKKYRDSVTESNITMEMFSGICANSVVLPNCNLAEGSILSANSLLTTETEPWTIYFGNPAIPIKNRKKEKIKKMKEEIFNGKKNEYKSSP